MGKLEMRKNAQDALREEFRVVWQIALGRLRMQQLSEMGYAYYLEDHPAACQYRFTVNRVDYYFVTIHPGLQGLPYEKAVQWVGLAALEATQAKDDISMKDLYRLASMHQRAHKHGHLSPMGKGRFISIAGERGQIAWEAAARARQEKIKRFEGWQNYFTHEAWIRAHHPEWPF